MKQMNRYRVKMIFNDVYDDLKWQQQPYATIQIHAYDMSEAVILAKSMFPHLDKQDVLFEPVSTC